MYSVYPGPLSVFVCMWLTVLVTQCTQCIRVLWLSLSACDLLYWSLSVSLFFVCLCLYVTYSAGHSEYSVYPGPLSVFVCDLQCRSHSVLSEAGSFVCLCLYVTYIAGHSVYLVYPGTLSLFVCMWLTVLVTQCTQCIRVLCLSLSACDLQCWSLRS